MQRDGSIDKTAAPTTSARPVEPSNLPARRPAADSRSRVERVYDELRRMAADFRFKPGERVNESVLAKTLRASRTPVREALNRLVAEGFLEFVAGEGFFCRALDPERIVELYEVRTALECEALRCSVARASEKDVLALRRALEAAEPRYNGDTAALALLDMDEAFHEQLVALSGNREFVRLLRNVNGRIRFVRLMDLERLRVAAPTGTPGMERMAAHRAVVEALAARDREAAVGAMREHIRLRREQALIAVRDAYARLYVEGTRGC